MTADELDEVLSRYLREVVYICAGVFFLLGFSSNPRNWDLCSIGAVLAAWAFSIQLAVRRRERRRAERTKD